MPDYQERLGESRAFSDRLMPLSPGLVAIELLDEAERLIAAKPAQEQALLQDRLQQICQPTVRAEARLQHQAGQLADEVESWLAGTTAAVEAPTHQRPARLMRQIDDKVADVMFGTTFHQNQHGASWNDQDTLWAVKDILRMQAKLGITVATDSVREALRTVSADSPYAYAEALELLIENARHGHDRPSFLAAADRFAVAAGNRWSATMVHAQPLVELAAQFIEAGKPHEFDEEAFDIALTALPFHDRVMASYPLLCGRLAVALQGFEPPAR